MKKILVVTLALAVLLGALAAVGCGGDTGKAKAYMEEGDALSKKMRSLTGDAVFDSGALLAELGIQVSETGDIDPQTITDAANKQIDTIIANGEKAKSEYEKVLDLSGVDAYKLYAEQRIKAIDSTILVLEAVKGLLDKLGDPTNKESVNDTVARWAKSNLRVSVDAVKAFTSWRSAEQIKKENNLGPVEEVGDVPAESSPSTSAPK